MCVGQGDSLCTRDPDKEPWWVHWPRTCFAWEEAAGRSAGWESSAQPVHKRSIDGHLPPSVEKDYRKAHGSPLLSRLCTKGCMASLSLWSSVSEGRCSLKAVQRVPAHSKAHLSTLHLAPSIPTADTFPSLGHHVGPLGVGPDLFLHLGWWLNPVPHCSCLCPSVSTHAVTKPPGTLSS